MSILSGGAKPLHRRVNRQKEGDASDGEYILYVKKGRRERVINHHQQKGRGSVEQEPESVEKSATIVSAD